MVVNSAVLVLKNLIQFKPASSATGSFSNSHLTVISHLARRIEDIRHPHAKACVLWLVGQFSATGREETESGLGAAADWAPDVLRKSAKSFRNEVLSFILLLRYSLIGPSF
jgi:AP-3 complex subunit beta